MACLSFSEELDQEIYDQGIVVVRKDLMPYGLDGHYYRTDDMRCPVITLSTRVCGEYECNTLKAHELGNHYNCSRNIFEAPSYYQNKYKLLSKRWEIQRYMPLDKIIAAIENGNTSPFSIADYLSIPVHSFMEGLSEYITMLGPSVKYDDYSIEFNPFRVKRTKKRGKHNDKGH